MEDMKPYASRKIQHELLTLGVGEITILFADRVSIYKRAKQIGIRVRVLLESDGKQQTGIANWEVMRVQ